MFDFQDMYNEIDNWVDTDRHSFRWVDLDKLVWIHIGVNCRNRLERKEEGGNQQLMNRIPIIYKDQCNFFSNHIWQLESFHMILFPQSKACAMDRLVLLGVHWCIRSNDNNCE